MAVSRINEAGLDVNQYGNRNLIINGGQQCWQRATATTTVTNSGYDTVDRFRFYVSGGGAYTSTRSTDVPSGQGFSFSNKLDVTTADTSLASSDYYAFRQRIEAQNCARLAYGTSGAQTITLSFWVKSNKTGIYCISLYKFDNTNYTYVKEYTIDSANTWEKKELTITPTAGSTTLITNSGGAIDVDNGIGLQLNFQLATGSSSAGATDDTWVSAAGSATNNQVNWMDSTSNNFYITGIQLEVGDTATDFEHRSFSDEVVKCQRYFNYVRHAGTASNAGLSNSYGNYYPQAPMRAVPTATAVGNDPLTAANFTAYPGGASVSVTINAIFETENGNITVRPYVAGNNTYTYMEGFISLDAEL